VTGVSVGRRYSRADEIGCPFGITIDHATLRDKDVTLRDRDTTVRACATIHPSIHFTSVLAAAVACAVRLLIAQSNTIPPPTTTTTPQTHHKLTTTTTATPKTKQAQIRVPIAQLVPLLKALIDGSQTWAQAMARFPVVRTGDEGDEDGDGENGGAGKPKGPTVVEKTPRGKFSRPAEAGAGAESSSSLEGKMAGMQI
jgi:hypothetical protein